MERIKQHIWLVDAADSVLIREMSYDRYEAFIVLMDRYMPLVSRLSYRVLCDMRESESVAKKVFSSLWKNPYSFDDRYSLRIWLCRNTCSLCRQRLFMHRLFGDMPIYEMSAPGACSEGEDFITKETWAIFCRASREMSSVQRIIYALIELEGLSTHEVTMIIGYNADMIRKELVISRNKIRKELERYGKVR